MSIQIDIEKGYTAYDAIQKAIDLAVKFNDSVEFTFNEVELCVSQHSFCEDILLVYALKKKIARLEHKTLKIF